MKARRPSWDNQDFYVPMLGYETDREGNKEPVSSAAVPVHLFSNMEKLCNHDIRSSRSVVSLYAPYPLAGLNTSWYETVR